MLKGDRTRSANYFRHWFVRERGEIVEGKMLKASRLIAGLILALLLTPSCRQLSTGEFDLVQRFSTSRTDHLVCLEGDLVSDAGVPFALGDPEFNMARGVVRFQGDKPGGLLFLLFHTQDVKVTLEGRLLDTAPVNKSEVVFSLNGEPVATHLLTNQWQSFEISLPASRTKVGVNTLTFQSASPVEWHKAVFSSSLSVPQLREGPDEALLYVPFGSVWDYPLRDATTLKLQLEPWLQPGAPPLENWELHLELTSDQGRKVAEWTIDRLDRTTLSLPEVSGHHILTASLRAPDALPGQSGLIFRGPLPSKQHESSPTQASETQKSPELKKKPNIILFVVDTLRTDYLQPYGCRSEISPFLQDFAKDAIVFENCQAPSPWTKPSVATLITSLSPSQHGVLDFADELSKRYTTLAEILEQAGYQNTAVVNNGLLSPMFGYAQGYETYRLVDKNTTGPRQVNWAIEQMRGIGKQPFFLHFHLLDPHLPYAPPTQSRDIVFRELGLGVEPDEWGVDGVEESTLQTLRLDSKEGMTPILQRRLEIVKGMYAGEVYQADRAFGILVAWLKQEGLYHDALIIVTSDHGEELWDPGAFGHPTSLYQELIHVPLMIKLPGNRRAGEVVSENCDLGNVTPTILAESLGSSSLRAGMVTLDQKTSNKNAPVFFGTDVGRDALLLDQGDRTYHILSEGVRETDVVLTHYKASARKIDPLALYNLTDDPGERKSLLWDRPALVLYLQSLLRQQSTEPQTVKVPQVEREEVRDILKGLQYLQ